MIRAREAGARRTPIASRARLMWSVIAVGALVLSGCGSSGESSSTAVTQEAPNTSSHLGPPSVQGGAQGAGQFSGRSGERKFQALANTVCSTVRTGTPPPLSGSAKSSALRGYAVAAAKPNQRTIVSLQRLGAPQPLRKQFERLLGSLRRLQSVYVQVGTGQLGKAQASALRRSMAMAEALASSDALASGVPGCAPHLLGVGAPPPRSGQGKR